MKKVLFSLACILMLASCAFRPMPMSFVNMVDYSPLTQEGLYVTESNSVSFNYTAIGSIQLSSIGGFVQKDKKSTFSEPIEDYYATSLGKKVYVKPEIQDVFKNLIDKLTQLDANGIINLKIEHSFAPHPLDEKLSVDQITVTGMAIKR